MLGPPPSKEEAQEHYEHHFKKWAKREPEEARHFTAEGAFNPNLQPHQFNVYWAHSKESIKAGRLEEGVSNVTVLGHGSLAGNIRAKLVAESMVVGRGKEPTRTEWVP
jgi:hypothetical protein